MTPRPEVEMIDIADGPDRLRALVRATRHTRLPVREGDGEAVLGVVMVKDILDAWADGREPDIRALTIEAPVIVDTSSAIDVLGAIRSTRAHMALVYDEYGHFEGLVTSGDVLEAITGVVLEDAADAEPACVQREDGSWLVAGWMPIDEFAERFRVGFDRDARYVTVAGFLLDGFGRIPGVGDRIEREGLRFEVVDLDGRRIDKILLSRIEP
jgi:putative hemolysin